MVQSIISILCIRCLLPRESFPATGYIVLLLLIMVRGRFVEYVLDHPNVRPVWKKFTEHDFVLGLGSGKLPVERFKEYLVQDYLYLVSII